MEGVWKEDLRKQSLTKRLKDLKQALSISQIADEQLRLTHQIRAVERCLIRSEGGYQR